MNPVLVLEQERCFQSRTISKAFPLIHISLSPSALFWNSNWTVVSKGYQSLHPHLELNYCLILTRRHTA